MAIRKTPSTTRRGGPPQTASESEGARRPRTATAPKKRTTAPKPPATMASTEHVRVRAYYLSIERHGCADPIADWLRAERELTTGKRTA